MSSIPSSEETNNRKHFVRIGVTSTVVCQNPTEPTQHINDESANISFIENSTQQQQKQQRKNHQQESARFRSGKKKVSFRNPLEQKENENDRLVQTFDVWRELGTIVNNTAEAIVHKRIRVAKESLHNRRREQGFCAENNEEYPRDSKRMKYSQDESRTITTDSKNAMANTIHDKQYQKAVNKVERMIVIHLEIKKLHDALLRELADDVVESMEGRAIIQSGR